MNLRIFGLSLLAFTCSIHAQQVINDLGNGYVDANGNLRSFGFEEADPVPSNPCALGVLTSGIDQTWRVGGNYFAWPQCDELTAPRFGTKQAFDLDVITDNQVRMVIGKNGKVGIGTTPPVFGAGHLRSQGSA